MGGGPKPASFFHGREVVDLSQQIRRCTDALAAVDLARQFYASSTDGQVLVGDIVKILERGGGGDLGRDIAVAIRRAIASPADRDNYKLPLANDGKPDEQK